jgi:polygalacturonase
MRYSALLLAALTATSMASAQTSPRIFDVRAHGATGDGVTLDTGAINQAIAAAAAVGGGTVVFPAGTYASFSIHLKSNVALYLDAGSTILAAEPPADLASGYDAPEPNPGTDLYEDFGHSHWHNSLIWGEGLENISITGPGRIFGRGLSRGSNRRDLLPEERSLAADARLELAAPEKTRPNLSLPDSTRTAIAALKPGPFGYPGKDTLPAGVGNKAIALKNCRNVIFRDFTIYHGGHFAILATGVDNWTVDGLKIDTNRDGIDFDCCQNVRVANCTVNSPYDDGICPKASFGLGYNRPTENVTITNCQVSGYDEGTLLDGTRQRKVSHNGGGTGRIKLGTEANGGFRNITVSNCVFEYCRGLALEEVDGGLMEDITISNITMRDIANAPIYIRLGARLRGPEPIAIGTARRIKIDNVVAHNVAAESGILLVGEPGHPIEDLSLSNIFIDFVGGGTKEQAAREVPAFERERYPEPSRLGTMPSWGLFARHVKNFQMDRVEFRTAQDDLRPVVMMEDVTDVTFSAVKLPQIPGVAVFALRDVHAFTTRACPGLPDKTIE